MLGGCGWNPGRAVALKNRGVRGSAQSLKTMIHRYTCLPVETRSGCPESHPSVLRQHSSDRHRHRGSMSRRCIVMHAPCQQRNPSLDITMPHAAVHVCNVEPYPVILDRQADFVTL